MRARAIVGTGAHVVDRFASFQAALSVDEIAVVSATFDADARRRSYVLIADAAGLSSR